MSSYLTAAELQTYALPPEAVQDVTTAQLQSECDAASTYADMHLRARYNLPLVVWDLDLKLLVAHIAAYNVMTTRGYSPEQGADPVYENRWKAAIMTLRDVARQSAHLNVTDSSPGNATPFPIVTTKCERGWGGHGVDSGGGHQSGSGL